MNILFICSADFAGVQGRLTRSIRRYTNHRTRLLVGRRHSLSYAVDQVCKKPDVIRAAVAWADVVNVQLHYGMLKRAGFRPGQIKKLVMTHPGSDYRRRYKYWNKEDRAWGAVQLCTTPDLSVFGPTWMPTAIAVANMQRRAQRANKHDPPWVVQAPTNVARKSTKEVAPLVKSVKGVRWVCIIKKQHKECLRLKAQATIGIDQFHYGYGVNGLEFFGMGIPTIGFADDWVKDAILKNIGYVPFVESPIKHVPDTIKKLLSDRDFYKSSVQTALDYVQAFHARPVVAKRYIRFLQERVL